MSKLNSFSLRFILAFSGLIIGGYVGFMNRPAAFVVGKLPFKKIILAGANLEGLEKALVSVARTSFNYMLVGAIMGLLVGIILGSALAGKPK